MDNFVLGEMVELFRRGILWFIVSVIFTTKELKDEAARHVYSGVVRIPGVCYGHNMVKGYRAIGQIFPQRCRIVRLDYIVGYIKIIMIAACITGIIILLAEHMA